VYEEVLLFLIITQKLIYEKSIIILKDGKIIFINFILVKLRIKDFLEEINQLIFLQCDFIKFKNDSLLNIFF